MNYKKPFINIIAISSTYLLVACGESVASKNAVCSDFQYQQDAQSAYNGGARQLDGDNDGVACESLPKRPNSGTSSPVTGNFSPSFHDFFLANGMQISLSQQSFNEYFIEFSDFAVSHGYIGSSFLKMNTVGEIKELSYDFDGAKHDWLPMKHTTLSNGEVLVWTTQGKNKGYGTGYGFSRNDVASISDMLGVYKLLGLKCDYNRQNCTLITATGKIKSDKTMTLCFNSEYSDNCIDGHTSRFDDVAASNKPVFKWNLGLFLGSKKFSTIAFSYKDNRYSLSTPNKIINEGLFVFFGLRDDKVLSNIKPFDSMLSFSNTGQLQNFVPDVANLPVKADKPLKGFFQDDNGNTYLRSNNGKLITWSPFYGFRYYANP